MIPDPLSTYAAFHRDHVRTRRYPNRPALLALLEELDAKATDPGRRGRPGRPDVIDAPSGDVELPRPAVPLDAPGPRGDARPAGPCAEAIPPDQCDHSSTGGHCDVCGVVR